MKKRILLIVLALILALSCLVVVSCTDNTTDTESSEGESNSQGGPGNQPSTPSDPSNPGGTPSANSDAIPSVQYLRVMELGSDSVKLKFNVYNAPSGMKYVVKYSDKAITEENFSKATTATANISGSAEVSVTLNGVSADASEALYIAIQPYKDNVYGKIATVRAGGNGLLPIDYQKSVTNVYHGESLRDFSLLFDEQDKLTSRFYFPETNAGILYSDNDENQKENKVGMILRPIINLEYLHYVSSVELYYGELPADFTEVKVRWATKEVNFDAEDSKWDGCVTIDSSEINAKKWNSFPIGEKTRYVQIVFKDGQAPNEVAIYGYQEGQIDEIATTKRPLPTMGEMMGMCGFVANGGGNTPIRSVSCTTVLREYHNFGWSYNDGAYPGMSNNFQGGMGSFDAQYSAYQAAGINVIPCVQWPNYELAKKVDDDGNPIKEDGKYVAASFFEKFNPQVYCLYADNMFCFAARYGSNTSADLLSIMRKHCSTAAKSAGAGTLQWIEAGNEPNGEDNLGMVPYQLAALQSACYDGHMKTLVSSKSDEGYHFGVKNADPNFKIAMAGLAGTGGRYITSMCYWLQANRTDGNLGMDAFNFHSYFSNTFYMNNSYIQVGVSPEYYNIVDDVSRIIEYRNKYFPDVEVWITEFGWDTNPSYETMTAAHAYGKYDSHQVQAMWLVRAYLLFSSIGIDKATMYMCEDVAYDVTAVGKYGTCGVIGFDEDGDEYCKDSYYYLYTLKNALGDYTFVNEIDSGSDDVWIYQYKNADGKTAYAVWCPTMDGTEVENFELKINGSSATLIEAVDLDTDGVSSELTVSNGAVKIHVSENPVYVMVD